MKPNKQKIIDDILIELEKGIGYNDCLVVIRRNWTLSESSFKRYWKTANEAYKLRQESINSILLAESTEAQKQRLKTAILTKDERMKILTDIANGKLNIVQEINTKFGIVNINTVPDFTERRNAIAELNKMDGSYAPVKSEINIENEIPIFSQNGLDANL